MGSATRHRQAFLKQNPRCAFCGGLAQATTIEHCPPRSMFQDRKWPEGFEFPSCERCNASTSNHDLLIALLGRMDPINDKGDQDGAFGGLVAQANRQFPGLFEKMKLSASEARQSCRALGVTPAPGRTYQETGVVNVPEEFHLAVCSLAAKLAKGVFYRETKQIFPEYGCLALNWFTNADLIRDGKYVVFDLLKDLGGEVPILKRSGQHLNNQFEYKWLASNDIPFFIFQASFGNSFGMAVWGCAERGRLEHKFDELKKKTGHDGPFCLIQTGV
jgi:hypothetical protein